ncbi:Nuclear body protein SP140-like protein, partial [Lemmus lemmus]
GSEYLSEEESPDYWLVFKRFRENKVEIASAITKPFPFFMSLRDHNYIPEQKFRNYLRSCENLIPVENVVYDILSDLQNVFSLSLLKVIFSPTHLKAYPDLKETVRNFPASCSPGSSQMNDEQAEEVPSFPQCNGGCSPVVDCLVLSLVPSIAKLNNNETNTHNFGTGAEQSASENEMCSCVMCSPALMPEDPEARMGSSQAGMTPRERREHEHMQRDRRKKSSFSVPRKYRNKNAYFSAELLPVTCGDMKGTLHKDRFKKGISVKSIQSEAGAWYTPTEFEILGGYGRSKNWKLSVRCHNCPLKLLIQVLQWTGGGGGGNQCLFFLHCLQIK